VSSIAITPTPLIGFKNLPAPYRNPESHAIITNPLRTQAAADNQRQWKLRLQLHAVSTPQTMVPSSRSFHQFGQSNIPYFTFATTRLLELHLWNRRSFISATNLETLSYATRRISKALSEAPHSQIIETYWNTAFLQNNIWSIAFETHTNEILKQVC
jgi:hypothetical protein